LIAYLIKGKGVDKGLPPKVRVHDFPFRAVLAAVDTAVAAVDDDTPRASLLYLTIAFLLLLWPVRPHTLVSCCTADVSSDGVFWYFKPLEHKRKPTDSVFAVRFPDPW
jgi:hypothetical protein